MNTLLLSQRDIARTMSTADYIAAVESAFGSASSGKVHVPEPMHLEAATGGFHIKAAICHEPVPYVAAKLNGNFPGNSRQYGLPTIQGAILLCDGNNGALLAIMDSAEVTAMRTAAATAVAAKYLAPPDATVATVIGCGLQGPLQLLALLEVLPIDTVYLHDTEAKRSEMAAKQLSEQRGLTCKAVSDFAVAARDSQVIVTATSSTKAFLRTEHVSPGTFVAAVGADNPHKQELDAELLGASRVVVDVLDQCAAFGELHHAIKAGVMGRAQVYAELGAIVNGTLSVSYDSNAIVVFDSTGTASQDLGAAIVIYERARQLGIGTTVQLS